MRVASALLALAAATLPAVFSRSASQRRIPVVLDTDIGTDFDDAFALIFMLARSDIYDLRLIQVSTFNTTQRAQITANILAAVGRFEVPIGVGRYTGEQNIPQYAFAANYSLEAFVADGGTVVNGTDYFASLMAAATPSEPLYIVEIAPATSLGDILQASPALAANCITVAMSGSVYRGYLNASTPSIEYNVVTDVPASQAMYNAQWLSPLVTAPLDSTIFEQFVDVQYQTLRSANTSGHPYVQTLLANYDAWFAAGGDGYIQMLPFDPTNGTSTLYDLQAAYMAAAFAGYYNVDTAANAGGEPAAYGAWFARGGHRTPKDAAAKQASQAVPPAAGPPAVANVKLQALRMSVTDEGYTIVDPAGQLVYAATDLAQTNPYDSVDAIAADVVASLITAPRF
jgi:inosine-uridine nucleoside N-ribohydrolase